jgi:nucleoside-triphosphatase THEP1
MLILLSGPIGAGKTTLCTRAAAAARDRGVRVAGVLAPAIVEGGAKVGIEAMDLTSGERKLLARNDRDLGGVRVGQYSFDDEALAWTLSLDEKALDSDVLAFIDEVGRLELDRGLGLAPLIPLLARPRQADTVAVVRGDLIDAMVARVAPAAPRVVTLDPRHRDAAWAELEALLFRC